MNPVTTRKAFDPNKSTLTKRIEQSNFTHVSDILGNKSPKEHFYEKPLTANKIEHKLKPQSKLNKLKKIFPLSGRSIRSLKQSIINKAKQVISERTIITKRQRNPKRRIGTLVNNRRTTRVV